MQPLHDMTKDGSNYQWCKGALVALGLLKVYSFGAFGGILGV
jgi:hypothetical protein